MYQGTPHLTELEKLEEEILFKVKRLASLYPKNPKEGIEHSIDEKELDRHILEALKKICR